MAALPRAVPVPVPVVVAVPVSHSASAAEWHSVPLRVTASAATGTGTVAPVTSVWHRRDSDCLTDSPADSDLEPASEATATRSLIASGTEPPLPVALALTPHWPGQAAIASGTGRVSFTASASDSAETASAPAMALAPPPLA